MAFFKILSFWYFIVLIGAKTLIDVEIEHTEQLMNLYSNKSSILQQIYDLKKEYNKLDPQLIETKQFEEALNRYETYVKKKRLEKASLYGLEQPLSGTPSEDAHSEQEKQKTRFESFFYERLLFDEPNSNITHFSLMNIKPLGKASSGGYMTQGVLIAKDNQEAAVYDVYKNTLFNISMAEHGGIKLIEGSQHHDDMYIVALSETNQLWEFNITLQRLKSLRSNSEDVENSQNGINTNENSNQLSGSEDLMSRRYKGVLKLYNYIVDKENWVSLHQLVNSTDVEFKQILTYMNKGEKFYLISDSEGYINVVNRGLSLRTRIFSGEKDIIQMVKRSITVIILQKNDIRFLKFFRGGMGSQKCHSGMAELTNIAVDSTHSGFIYGATTTGEILIFKAVGLVNNVDNIQWSIQGKLKLHFLEDAPQQVRLASLSNHLLALKSDGTVEMFDITNMQEFLIKPVGYSINLFHSQFILDQSNLVQIITMKSYNGDIILLGQHSPNGGRKVAMYEWLTPKLRESNEFSFFNFKFPMFFIAFAVVLFVQFFNKKDGEPNDILSILFGLWGGGKSRGFKSKKQKQMEEVEELVKRYTQQTDELNKQFAAKTNLKNM